MVATAVIGGTATRLAGGKFGNGAVTAAFSYAFEAIARRPSPGSDGNQLTLEDAKNAQWPSADEARSRLAYSRFALAWLHDQGMLGADYNFAFQGDGFLDFNYTDTFKESWQYPDRALLAEAPLNGQPIQFYKGGVSTNDIGNFRTYAHEVLHRSPLFSVPYQSGQQSLMQIHNAMLPIVDAARAMYVSNQGAIDAAWGGIDEWCN